MKKKEVSASARRVRDGLIIFVLAILVTALTPLFQGARIEYGWPLAFLWVGFPVPQKWLPLSLLVDLLFWFLVLAIGVASYKEKDKKQLTFQGTCGRL